MKPLKEIESWEGFLIDHEWLRLILIFGNMIGLPFLLSFVVGAFDQENSWTIPLIIGAVYFLLCWAPFIFYNKIARWTNGRVKIK